MSSACPSPAYTPAAVGSVSSPRRAAAFSNSARLSSRWPEAHRYRPNRSCPERLALRWRPDLERCLRDLDGAFVPGGGTGELGGLPEPVAAVGLRGAVAGVVPELEGPLEMGERGAGGDRRRRVGGGEQGDEGAFAVAGPVEVEGELAGPVGPAELGRRLLLEGFGDAAMEPGALRRQQIGVHDLADEGVTEPVGVGGGVDHDQLRVHRGADRPLRWPRRRGRRSPAAGRASCPVPRRPWRRRPGGPGRRVRRCPPRSGPRGRRGSPRRRRGRRRAPR